MTADRSWAEASGTLRDKDKLRVYGGKAFQLLPNLRFDLIDTYVSPDSVVVFYQNERGAQICEYLRLDAGGKIRQGSANHLAH
jgi:hypothetical protein